MKMEYTVNVIRGWPNGSALDRAEPIKSGVTLNCGDWVQKQSDNTVDLSTSTKANNCGLVIRGNGDSSSGAYTGKATVLWSNFIAQVSNYDGTGTYAPGTALTVKSGKLINGVVGTDPIIGHVLDVVAVSATQTAHLVVKIN